MSSPRRIDQKPPKPCTPAHATKLSFVFSDKEIEYMKNYRCRGVDNSILNKYVCNYFYDFLVNKVFPPWLAPNVLTMMGPVPSIISTVVVILFAPNLDVPLPGWIQLLLAFSVFFYLVCDNCDGKHARHINCCSPLGDFLDHSLDTITFSLMLHNLAAAFGFGASWATYIIISGCLMAHVLVMWEAYYTGEIILNYIEACTEGVFAIACVHLVFIFLGEKMVAGYVIQPNYFSFLPDGLLFKTIAPLIAFLGFSTSLLSVKRVIGKYFSSEGLYPLVSLLPFFFMWGLNAFYGYCYPEVTHKHFHRWIFSLASHQIWWIHNLIVAKLTGRRLVFKNLFNMPLFLPFLLWIATFLTSAEQAIKVVPVISLSLYVCWWFACVRNFTKKLGKPLLTVPKQKSN